VAAVLESLSRKRTSGVLEVDGNPAGAIYLDRGQITFARASWVPDLTARLCGVLRPGPELRNLLRGSDQADRDIGAMLVQRGFMTQNELQSILRSAVVDALIVLTMPLVGGSSISDIRFEAPGAHWAAAFTRLPLEAVQSEVTRRADQMARVGVAHTAPVALTDLDRGPAFLTRDQWAIACRVNGTLTPRDLARQSGLALYDTITALGTLLRRGLCTLATPAPAPREGREGAARRPDAVPRATATLGGPRIPPPPVGPVAPAAAGITPGPADVLTPATWTIIRPGPDIPAQLRASGQPEAPIPPGALASLKAPAPSVALASPEAPAPVAPVQVAPAPVDVPAAPVNVPPAPVDVPPAAAHQLPPAQPDYRRPLRPQWSTVAPPVPSAVLAAPAVPAEAAPATTGTGPARATRRAETAPVPVGSEAGPSATAEATGPYRAHEPRRSRGAHRADPATRPPAEAPAGPADPHPRPGTEEARSQDPAEPAATLPYPRRPVLPHRDPDARLVRPRNATEPLPVATRVWPGPEPAGGSESETYASSGPDLLRRVLEGLRRLT